MKGKKLKEEKKKQGQKQHFSLRQQYWQSTTMNLNHELRKKAQIPGKQIEIQIREYPMQSVPGV